MKYQKISPKDKKTSGHVSSKFQQQNVDAGTHTFVITEIVDASWSKKLLMVGETIEAFIETVGYKDGTVVEFDFFETDSACQDMPRGTLKSKISGNKASVTFKYTDDFLKKITPTVKYSNAGLYFNVWTESENLMSAIVPLYTDLSIKVVREGGKPVDKVEFILEHSTGQLSTHVTDTAGMVIVKKMHPRYHKIKFPKSGRIIPEGETVPSLSAPPVSWNILASSVKTHVFNVIELYVYCSHKTQEKRRSAANTTVFEVVPDATGKDASKDEVTILSRTATSLTCSGKALEKKDDEFGMHAFKLACQQEFGNAPDIFSGDFWSGLKNPKNYVISGLPGALTVKCYRPDIYKLQIQFPALKKWEGGSKVALSTKDVKNDLKNKPVKEYIKSKMVLDKKGWDIKKFPMAGSSELPVTLSRNGYELKINFLKAVGAIVELGNNIFKVIQTVQDNAPKIGWYFDFEMQLWQGTFAVEWGWKEFRDHRAYYYVGANIDLKIIDLKFEVGFGVKGFSFKVQVYVSLKGAASVSTKISRYSPDGDVELAIPFGTEIIGNVGARVQVGCFLKLEGTAESGFKIADGFVKFQQNEGWSAECSLKWTGLTLKVNVSGGVGKKGGTEETKEPNKKSEREFSDTTSKDLWSKEFWGPVDIGKRIWPKDERHAPPVISAEDFHEMLVKKLTDGDNIRIKTGSSWGHNEYLDYSDVAKIIEKKIHVRNDIRKDPKAMEALCDDIRKLLEGILLEDTSIVHFKSIPKARFDNFVNGTELHGILEKTVDPLWEIVAKNP